MAGLCVAVLGLGEAGGLISRDLVQAEVDVRGYDPAVTASGGVVNCTSEADAVQGADIVLSVNSAADATTAADNGLPAIAAGAVWADLNTSGANLKRELADRVSRTPGTFVDVALMSPVPGRGLRTPMLASGEGAERYADAMIRLGADVEVLPGEPGDAATRKLLRSVFFKGMAAAVVEALTAARAAGCEEWLRANIADELVRSDAATVERLERGSVRHAVRRGHEMDAAAGLLTELGVPNRVAVASRDLLEELAATSSASR
jgi:3-hydroxyisobutyrate dehydrogenase-like beta-hydroxyacid dehydrogenase